MSPILPDTVDPADYPLINPGVGDVPSFGDSIAAGFSAHAIEINYNDHEGRTKADIVRGLTDILGADNWIPLLEPSKYVVNGTPDPVDPRQALQWTLQAGSPQFNNSGVSERFNNFAEKLFAEINRLKAEDPVRWQQLDITSKEQLDAEVTRRRQAEYQDALATLNMESAGSSVANFLGAGAAEMTDPRFAPLMVVGGGAGMGLKAIIATEAVMGGLGAAALLPSMKDQSEKLNIPEPDATTEIAMGMVFGAALPVTLHGISSSSRMAVNGIKRYLDMRAGRNATPTPPPGVNSATTEALVRDTEAALANDEPVPQVPDTTQAESWRNAIASVESRGSGDYAATGPVMTSGSYAGDRAYGRYQIMGRNIPAWSQQYLGRDMTIDEFMANPDLQDELFDAVFGSYVAKWGNPQDAASVWFTGRPLSEGANRSDGFITGSEYVNRFTNALENPQSGAPRAPTGGGVDIPTGTRAGYTAPDQVVTPSGTRIDVAYEVVDASLLTRASGDLQPRDRTRSASDEWIAKTAAELDPSQLMPSPLATSGTPIVSPENYIESGNGRIAAINRAYELHPDRTDAYRAAIRAAGFDIPPGVKEPVLVARRKTSLSHEARVDFVNEANADPIASHSPTERSVQDARALSIHTMAQYVPGKAISAPENTKFAMAFLNGLPPNARGALITADGHLSLDGERRLLQALFARAYGAPDLIAKHTEAGDPAMRSLIDALAEAAPAWSALRADIEAGLIKPEMDLTDHLLDAVRLIGDARKTAAKEEISTAGAIDDALAQISLDGQIHPLTEALVQIFRKGDRVRPDREITELLDGYTNEARILGKTDAAFFRDELSSGPMEVLDAIQKETDLFAPGGPGTRPRDESLYRQPNRPAAAPSRRQAQEPLDTSQINEQDYIDGAQSEGSIAADEQAIEDLRSQLQVSAPDQAKIVDALADMKARQPFTTVEQLYAKNGDAPSLVEAAQADLSSRGRAISAETGIEFKDPGPKVQATVEKKMTRKRYASATQLTDTARGGFILKSTEDAEAIISAFRETGEIVDEGWSITNTGYLDRKVLVRTENGVIAEVQLWIDQVFEAKKRRGHAIYTERRSGGITPERAAQLREEEISLYAAALREAGVNPSKLLGGSKVPKVPENSALNSASDATTAAVSSTSRASTGSQSPPFSSKASASPLSTENNTAGRPSQLANTIVDTSSTKVSALRAEVKNSGDFEIAMPDGQTYRASEILDDLDADANASEIINLCNPKGGA